MSTKNRPARTLNALLLLCGFAIIGGTAGCDRECNGESSTGKDLLTVQSQDASPAIGEIVRNENGFGIYQEFSDSADVSLTYGSPADILAIHPGAQLSPTRLSQSDEDEQLLAVSFGSGDVFTVKRSFSGVQSLCGCSGIEMEFLTVNERTSGLFRAVLTDRECHGDLVEDEVYVAESRSAFDVCGWQKLRFPLSTFSLSGDEGTRNDEMLNLKCSTGIGFNLFAPTIEPTAANPNPRGLLLIRRVKTY